MQELRKKFCYLGENQIEWNTAIADLRCVACIGFGVGGWRKVWIYLTI